MGKVDEKAQPNPVVKEGDTRIMCSVPVREKEAVDEHMIMLIIALIKEFGKESSRNVLNSDQISSVKWVIYSVIQARGDTTTVPEHSPVGSQRGRSRRYIGSC